MGIKTVMEEMKARVILELKGQDINSFETPQYTRAHLDRIYLFNTVEQLKKQIKELENVAESWMNDYQKMKDKYEPEIVYYED